MQAENLMEERIRKMTEAETIARENGCSLTGGRRINGVDEISVVCRVVTPEVFEAFKEAGADPVGAYLETGKESIRVVFRWTKWDT